MPHDADCPGDLEYNATVTLLNRIHDDLLILRVQPDDAYPPFEAGQYTTLGLNSDEHHLDGLVPPEPQRHRLIRRAYSISSEILDPAGQLRPVPDPDGLEFYIALVRRNSDAPPSLTPRIFAMASGHRIHLGMKPRGTYTLAPLSPHHDVLLLSTGTGEAPHNAMVHELLRRGHRGRIVSFVCVRHQRDLAYLETHRRLQAAFDNYQYVTLTTRDPINTDPDHPEFRGRRYLQNVFASDALLLQMLGWIPDPQHAHIFLCGNPAMIGVPRHEPDGPLIYPDPRGMIETLVARGFQPDRPRQPANVHFENYW